ncbi:MAG TPA: ATP-binding protein [Patescibacteria group bacterium]|nr:ATP-binding protein [Patescibacteria group bacterium]
MFKPRYLESHILSDLKEKMVFVGGPRQVGKTTLAKYIGEQDYVSRAYLNWDNAEQRKMIISNNIPADAKLIIFDELHKYRSWKNYIKGIYDTYKGKFSILVTGSARLDVYRRGGDSLLGRYHYFRLHPFSVREVMGEGWQTEPFDEIKFLKDKKISRAFSDLLTYGGFPEPYLAKNPQTLRRFHNERSERLIKEDIRDVENIQDISLLQVLSDILPSKVGSLLSLNSLQEDLAVTHKTISRWVDMLERFYYHFRIYPFKSSLIKSLRKQPKMYMWDWSQVENEAARLENMVASHLLKTAHLLYDYFGFKAEVYYLRDTEGREVDFLLTVDRKPWFSVEVKQNDTSPSSHLKYFGDRLRIPFQYQVVGGGTGIDYLKDGIRTMSVDKFLSGLA